MDYVVILVRSIDNKTALSTIQCCVIQEVSVFDAPRKVIELSPLTKIIVIRSK